MKRTHRLLRAVGSLWFFWIGLLSVFGCASRPDQAELPRGIDARGQNLAWEYRYGESPVDGQGKPLWAGSAGAESPGWQPTTTTVNPAGRGKHTALWLRMRLSGPPQEDATLFLLQVSESFEAYVDGREIYRSPVRSMAEQKRYTPKHFYLLGLGPDYVGKYLVLRCQSRVNEIGVYGTVSVGSRAAVLMGIVERGLPALLVGMLMLLTGIATLVVYALSRQELMTLAYSSLSLSTGLYLLSRSMLRSLVLEGPGLWRYTDLAMLCLSGAAFGWFLSVAISKGPWRLVSWMWRVFLGVFLVGAVLNAAGLVQLEQLLVPIQVCWLLLLALVLTITVEAVRSRNTDGIILSVGLTTFGIVGVWEILISLRVLAYQPSRIPLAVLLFDIALGVIWARRFFAVQQRMQHYSTMLQVSLAMTKTTSDDVPGSQEQGILAELLRMLHAERALLLLSQSPSESQDGTAPSSGLPGLDLAAARDAAGQMHVELDSDPVYDAALVQAVLEKRRPLLRVKMRSLSRPTNGSGTRDEKGPHQEISYSVIAAPLLASGKLLGVLYLEADTRKHVFATADAELLLGLAGQVALTMMTSRAAWLERESTLTQKQLDQQSELLSAIAKMLGGDLTTPIAVQPKSSLVPLAEAIEKIRLDQLAKRLRRQQSRSEGQDPLEADANKLPTQGTEK